MKGYIRLGSHVLLALAVLTLWQGGTVARADQIVGVFSNPIVQGNVLNDPTVGTLTSLDNTGTALVGVNSANAGCSGANTLCWGSDPGAGLPLSQQYSELTFTGANVTGPNQTIGTINFLNGTSALNSLIFGATLTFFDATAGMTNLGSDINQLHRRKSDWERRCRASGKGQHRIEVRLKISVSQQLRQLRVYIIS